MQPSLKWLDRSQEQKLVDCWQKMALQKALTIDTTISRREVPPELNNNQIQRCVNICKQLLANPQNIRFCRRIVTGDENWIYFRTYTLVIIIALDLY